MTCFDIQIKDVSPDTQTKQIKITGSTNGDYKFEDTKSFSYKPVNYFRLIETDKPAYKPGEKG